MNNGVMGKNMWIRLWISQESCKILLSIFLCISQDYPHTLYSHFYKFLREEELILWFMTTYRPSFSFFPLIPQSITALQSETLAGNLKYVISST